jgi:hypothetical protein
MHAIWEWILNFTGVNYQQNNFATHMYNFWSGFGGDITEFAIIGTLITIYRHHTNHIKKIDEDVRKLMLVKKKSDKNSD